MSFLRYKKCITEGDTVIVCRGREKIFPVRVERGRVIQVRGGAVHHDTLIGREFGSKMYTSNGKNWVLVLHPTPELWTVSLPHRTQILYSTDIAMVTLQLGLRPGSVVVESGTGSGSLSHALARTVAPDGHLYTFEFHEQRVKIASEEFKEHGLEEVVTLSCRDVCADGFGLEGVADAVFLDIPSPWEAIGAARTAMKATGGRLCSFSPCVEQVQKTSEKLKQLGFVDVVVMECLLRPYDVRQCSLSIPYMGLPERTSSAHDSHMTYVGDHMTSHEDHMTSVGDHMTSHEDHMTSVGDHMTSHEDHMTVRTSACKRRKLVQPTVSSVTLHTAQPCRTTPGHTGFLTFATLSATS